MYRPSLAPLPESGDHLTSLYQKSQQAASLAQQFADQAEHDFLQRYFERRSRHLQTVCSWLQHLPTFSSNFAPFVVDVDTSSLSSDEEILASFIAINDELSSQVSEILAADAIHPFGRSALTREYQELHRHRRCLLTLKASLQLG